MTPEELGELIAIGYERRGIEFKGPGSLRDKAYAVKVVRAVLGMANRRDGGLVVLGVDEREGKLDATGVGEEEQGSWSFDLISEFVAPYADPSASFDLEHLEHEGKLFVVLRVHEFEDVPVLCAKSYEPTLRRGACYVRTRRKPETSEIPTQTEMRELIELAVEKRLHEMLGSLQRAGLSLERPGPTDDERFDEQIGDLS
ncbi:MAG: ATP-binding protein [Actinomycetota bacterium]